MLHGSTSPGLAGSELIRLLSRLAGASPTLTEPAFAERLAQWISWNDAIAVSTVLGAGAVEVEPGRQRAFALEDAEFNRTRATLETRITDGLPDAGSGPAEFAAYGEYIVASQSSMQWSVGVLRRRLRDALARYSPALARLAAIDAVMQSTLADRERSVLGLVALRLRSRFERSREAAAHEDRSWLPTFREDVRLVLLAELEHRLLPAQGLLAALRQTRELE